MQYHSFRVWDLHVHLTTAKGATPEDRLGDLLSYADRMGIERLCVYMGLKFIQDPSPAELRSQNDDVWRAIDKYPDRAFGFVYLSAQHIDASLEELERCVAQGPMVGIKLWIAKRCNDESIDPIIARAAELKAVIFQHTWQKTNGNFPGESTPGDLVQLARRFPQLALICGHTGGNWEWGIRTIREMPHIYCDLAGSDPTSGITEMAVRELGIERVIYGSDAGGRSFASQLAKVYGADLTSEQKQRILCDNLRQLLLPILEAKGIRT